MKTLVKLVCTDVHRKGGKIVLPMAGEVEVSEEGIILVEQEVADFMVENGGDNYILYTEVAEVAKEKKASKKDVAAPVDDITDEKAELKANLESLELEDLVQMAIESGIAESEFKKFLKSKPLMVNFLVKNA
ncbi:MAG: hypothetical protein ACRCSZ_05875 [Lactococcus lactis]